MPTSSKQLDANEYVMAVARALNMPDAGIRKLLIECDFPGPVIVTLEYIKMGEPSLLEVMPKVEVVQVESSNG